MMKQPKWLLLTANYGNGHVQVARSLEEEILSRGTVNVITKDLYYETNPLLHEWTKKIYLKSYTKSGRHFYRLWYYGSQQIAKRKNLSILSYGLSKLNEIITEEQPDIIINTFPFFATPFHRHKMNSFIPTYNIITDYCLHHSWLHPNIDKYYVATEKLQEELIRNGIIRGRIVVSGMPIHKDYQQEYCYEEIIQKLQLNHRKKTVLIVAGAYGVSEEIKNICDGLKDDPSIQMIIVCGKNHELFTQLKTKYKEEDHISVVGFVTEMAELFKVATCVITKPGGIILSEAIAMNTPVVLPKAIPGQERENALFFQQQGAAIWNEKWDRLVIETKNLVRNEKKQKQMKEALSKLYRPMSTKLMVDDILEDFNTQHGNKSQKMNVEAKKWIQRLT